MPIRVRFDIHSRASRGDDDVLYKCRILEMLRDPDNTPQWTALQQANIVGLRQIPMLFLKIGVNIPGVPPFRFVSKRLQQVAAYRILWTSRVRVRRRERFRIALLVKKAGDASRLRIN